MASEHPDPSKYRFGRLRLAIGMGIAAAICRPKRWLARRRHDNHCDACDEWCGPYAMERLVFPFDTDYESVNSRSTAENLRGMAAAEYRRVCLDCGAEEEGDDGE